VSFGASGLGAVISAVLRFYELLIIVYVLMSWFPVRGMLYDIYQVLATVTEPYLGVFRRVIPVMGGFDFSPMVAIIVLDFVRVALAQIV
jgi:uncharacterized protein YggT (Ycf19 family)